MGTLHSTHAVATDRRHVLGRVVLIVALASAALLALSFVLDLGGAQNGLVFALIPLVLATPAAVVLLRAPRTPQLIELTDDGIAHVVAGARRSWAWDQVRVIDEYPDSGATILFTDGAQLHFGGATENSRVIVGALGTHCPDASRSSLRGRNKGRAAALMGTIALITGGVAVWGWDTGPTVFTVACAVPAVLSLILLVCVLVTGRR
ncbi:hypothetical protein ACSHWB_37380 [Lentzea sp. HUAS TT2]|uniref:hypothetical protein n=1 Tax=Lentzea sp. HUAS TT2 TaxID=3447454 RepID=UPI003F70FE65